MMDTEDEPDFDDIVGTDVKPQPELGGTLSGSSACPYCQETYPHGHTIEYIKEKEREMDRQTSGAYS